MIKRNSYILYTVCALLALASCTGNGDKGSRPPIVLGDSATIVTETDPQYTRDLVSDLHPDIPTNMRQDEEDAKPAHTDTVQPKAKPSTPQQLTPSPAKQAAPPVAVAGKGLTVAFKDVSVTIPGLVVKSYRNQDPLKLNGVSYQLVSGNIVGSRIVITSGTVLKVSQRYESELVVNGDDADLTLDNLTTTTDWTPIPGNKNTYLVKGLEVNKLEAPDFTANSLRNAITRAARRHRLPRHTEQELQASVRRVRRANQRPLSTALRSVMWKIDGKDASGKMFSKQVRVDVE